MDAIKRKGHFSGIYGKYDLADIVLRSRPHPEAVVPPALHGFNSSFVTQSKILTTAPCCRMEHSRRFCSKGLTKSGSSKKDVHIDINLDFDSVRC